VFAQNQTVKMRRLAQMRSKQLKQQKQQRASRQQWEEQEASRAEDVPPSPMPMPLPTPMPAGDAGGENAVDLTFDWAASPSSLALYNLAAAMAEHRRRGGLTAISVAHPPVNCNNAGRGRGSASGQDGAEGGEHVGSEQRSAEHMGAVGRVYAAWVAAAEEMGQKK
jgi:hypothetical protein